MRIGANLAGALTTSIGSAATAGLVGGTVYGLARGKNLKDSLKRGAKVAAITGAAQGIGAFDPLKRYAPGSIGAAEGTVTVGKDNLLEYTPGTSGEGVAPAGGSGAVKPNLSGYEVGGAKTTVELGSGLDPVTFDASGNVVGAGTGTQLANAPATFGQQLLGGIKSLNPFGGETGLFSGLSPTARTFATTATALSVLPILMPQEIEQYQQESGIALTQEDIDALTGRSQGGPPSPAAIAFAKFYRDRQNYQGAGGQQVGGSGIPTLMEGGEVAGPGTGTSDSIPALLSDGEFVMTARAVRNAGDGNRRKGAAKMYKLMKELETA